jgi:germination protein M
MRRTGSRASRAPGLLVLLLVVAGGVAAVRFLPRRALILWRWPSVGPDHVATTPPRRGAPPASAVARVHFLRVVDGKERMVPVTRQVPATAPATAALEELIAGEVPKGCARPVPAGVSLRGVTVTNGIATADFSRELISGFRGGSDSEGVTVYAIVNTLTSISGVQKVQLLVEGEKVDTIGGHLDVSGPLSADRELVVPGN